MQNELNKFVKRKRRRKQVMALTAITMFGGLVVVGVHQCGAKLQDSIQEAAKPMDDLRSQLLKYKKLQKKMPDLPNMNRNFNR